MRIELTGVVGSASGSWEFGSTGWGLVSGQAKEKGVLGAAWDSGPGAVSVVFTGGESLRTLGKVTEKLCGDRCSHDPFERGVVTCGQETRGYLSNKQNLPPGFWRMNRSFPGGESAVQAPRPACAQAHRDVKQPNW